jgi:hypothetical protein
MAKKKRKRSKNPLLEKKWLEGYEQGKKDGVGQAVSFFLDRFKGLQDVPGIGEKTMEKIKKQLGEKYFR